MTLTSMLDQFATHGRFSSDILQIYQF